MYGLRVKFVDIIGLKYIQLEISFEFVLPKQSSRFSRILSFIVPQVYNIICI